MYTIKLDKLLDELNKHKGCGFKVTVESYKNSDDSTFILTKKHKGKFEYTVISFSERDLLND